MTHNPQEYARYFGATSRTSVGLRVHLSSLQTIIVKKTPLGQLMLKRMGTDCKWLRNSSARKRCILIAQKRYLVRKGSLKDPPWKGSIDV